MRKLLQSVIGVLFFWCMAESYAQIPALTSLRPSVRKDNYWSIGIQANALNYFGDLNPKSQYLSTDLTLTRPQFGLQAIKKLNPNFYLRGSLFFGRLQGDDFTAASVGLTNNATAPPLKDNVPDSKERINRYARNLSFRNDIAEFAISGIYEFGASRGRFYRRTYVAPYLVAGVGVFYHNPKAKLPETIGDLLGNRVVVPNGGKWVALQPLGTEGQRNPNPRPSTLPEAPYNKPYSLVQMAVPMGAGIRFRIADQWDLSFEMALRVTTTDYIDDVSGNYADIRDIPTVEGRILADRSAEVVAVMTGQTRPLAQIQAHVGGVSPNFGGYAGRRPDGGFDEIVQTASFSPADNNPYARLASYGLRNQIRGWSGKVDVYLVSGFHLNYILKTARSPKFN
ncbi:MAG: hypothetical protein NZ551_10780 [Microscillaceae bacterium]|nr:hypothetical protein [Microscillaceae bacterium]MDW8461681.1 hypothetical protein [Cytophagales bacterium]